MAFAARRAPLSLAALRQQLSLATHVQGLRTAPRAPVPLAAIFPGFNNSLRTANIGNQIRKFAAAQPSLEERVISAVNKYAGMRKEELNNQDDAEDKTKALEALSREVTVDTKWDDLGFDDLDKVEVLLEVEEEFNHVIPDDDADRIMSVRESIEYLKKHLDS
mmetsp:Transcript_62629/g.123800  ORF Transcript_62629/g.123800 Transcript_62629/m.123800 type:complete len:163 (+) Transcript_62629:107-595(+)|eukprot:CAMPEP_0172679200 /NCGR_PEP_ID=MMETSP1074-20121228/15906_1 /TAXON_ID=2916 /ORGANISM="Ceratium fusus, Strain PA161109" /LENGTH=162 /DNA_ID=CAMNT_0013497335 /DNA_START=24 /DNA_END=512 /DNA_ORIENTATION=+